MVKKLKFRKPSWFIFLATVVGVIFFSFLGVWQLQRAEVKNQILFENEQRKNNVPLGLSLPVNDPSTLRFQRVQLQGKYLSSRQFVLDNQILQHQVGYNILTPFILDHSTAVVLVDRGWVPLRKSRAELPNISIDEQSRSIIGSVYVPFGTPFHLGGIDNGETTWPRLIQYLDFTSLEDRLELKLLPLTVRLEAHQEGGFKTAWPLFSFTPKRHFAYAVQWFALAITVLVIFVCLHLSRRTAKKF